MDEIKQKNRKKRVMAMSGTNGYFLKIMAMSGAMDLEGIRTFYRAHKGVRAKDRNMNILKEAGLIEKNHFQRKTYYNLTQKGKNMVLARNSKNALDCSEYLSGKVVTNLMPMQCDDHRDKMLRCIYQGRILSEMYQGKIPVFWTDKEDIFKNKIKIRYAMQQLIERPVNKTEQLENMAEEISNMKREELGVGDIWENQNYDKKYGLYLHGREEKSLAAYYPSTEIKNHKNPALKQSRALGCLIVKQNAPYVLYYMDNKLIRWKAKAEADMRKWVGTACEKMFNGRYQGDTEFVRGLFIVKNYEVVYRMIIEEEQSHIKRNITLNNRVYTQNHYATLEDMEFYYDPGLVLKIVDEILKRYSVKNNNRRFTYNGMRAWFGFRVSSLDIEQMKSGYVFCMRSQAKLYEELGMYPIEINDIVAAVRNF